MELIEIIRSSVLIFIIILFAIAIISFALFKIRNQAKIFKPHLLKSNETNQVKITHTDDNFDSKIIESKTVKMVEAAQDSKSRYEVVNKTTGSVDEQNDWLRFNNQPNIYKFYEETISSEMFKVSVADNIASMTNH